jgi:two-component system response regulator FlrC
MNHGWNGNVRELENVLERAMILGGGDGADDMVERLPELGVFLEERPLPAQVPPDAADSPAGRSAPGDVVRLRHLTEQVAVDDPGLRPADLREAVRLFERRHIQEVLVQVGFDKRKAARMLGISLASLYRKLTGEPAPDTPPDEE